jgi:hypothetical protein
MVGLATTSHGVALVKHVLQAGLRPAFALIVAETDAHLEHSRSLWTTLDWSSGLPTPSQEFSAIDQTKVEPLYLEAKVPYIFVPGLNSDVACDLLVRTPVDALLLAESPVLKGRILSAPRCGIINIHAAPLPEYRGNYATYWALYYDDPLYVSAHLVDRGIDTGPILARSRLPVHRGDTLQDIDRRGFEACGKLAADTLRQALQWGLPLAHQARWQGRTFRGSMPQEIIRELERRLRSEEYSHYE